MRDHAAEPRTDPSGPVRASGEGTFRRVWDTGARPARSRTPLRRRAAIAAEFAAAGTPRVVVKAQVKAGGRGKAGGVKLATGPDEAAAHAAAILGMDIKGHTVHKVLVEEASDIAAEYYFSYLLDRANRTFLSICSAQGGMEIEEVARSSPEAVARVPVSPLTGVDQRQGDGDRHRGWPATRGLRGRGRACREAVGHVRRRGRHARRDQPDDLDARRPGGGSGRKGHAG